LFVDFFTKRRADSSHKDLMARFASGLALQGITCFCRLLEEFTCHIQDLKLLDDRIQRKVEKLEQSCQKEAREYARHVEELLKSNQVAFKHFQELDDHISNVATKVCHLGDQLEGVNAPRQRAVEAQSLMKYFNEFLNGSISSEVFSNRNKVPFYFLTFDGFVYFSSLLYRGFLSIIMSK
uniref:exocyst complex component 5-like n=1 Tax=Myxine glutinosa TaxID=7769 RepID=UPI00358FAC54